MRRCCRILVNIAMAFKEDKFEDNVPGKFYVDKTCIFCNVCIQAAPSNFAMSGDGAHDYVYKQPETDEELDECYDALEQCPVEAIGDDGE